MNVIEEQQSQEEQACQRRSAEVSFHLANAQNELTAALKLMPPGERAQLCLCAAGVVSNVRNSL